MRGSTGRLVFSLVLVLLAAPLGAAAQVPGKLWRIGVLVPAYPSPGRSPQFAEFWQGLRELGYIEGENIAIEWRFAEGKLDRLPDLAADLVRLKVNVIFAVNTPAAMAAKNATITIPIVFVRVTDPVADGIVASLARPGGNITGLGSASRQLSSKGLELLREALPTVSRVAVLWDHQSSSSEASFRILQQASRQLGLRLQDAGIRGVPELQGVLRGVAKGGAGALLVIDDLVISSLRTRILDFAARNRLPVIARYKDFAEDGGLIAYGPKVPDMYRRAATLVDKILKGAKPADLPVEEPTRFELVVNLKTAKTLGLTIPPSVLIRADQVIQ